MRRPGGGSAVEAGSAFLLSLTGNAPTTWDTTSAAGTAAAARVLASRSVRGEM